MFVLFLETRFFVVYCVKGIFLHLSGQANIEKNPRNFLFLGFFLYFCHALDGFLLL